MRQRLEMQPMEKRGSNPDTADVVIVGGGIIGLSIAFHLAELGTSNVILIERDTVASGATSHATGGIRQQFTSEPQVRLSVESVQFYERFTERVGQPLEFRQVGYLFLLSTGEQYEAFKQGVSLQRSLGVSSELISPDEIGYRYTAIVNTDLLGAAFCPTDGVASPADAAYGLASRWTRPQVRLLRLSSSMPPGHGLPASRRWSQFRSP
jgi:sarcosine oxidase subunit beta